MIKDIELIFHNEGLRSYIEVDLCMDCPRQDDKGCCGHYSPIFYPTDFAYLLKNHPNIMDQIMQLKDVTILDTSLTINNSIDGESYKCQFHTQEKGCLLEQIQRETICRHFVCSGINWEEEQKLKQWKDFFNNLFNYEIELNQKIAQALKEKHLTLRDKSHHQQFFAELLQIFARETQSVPDFLSSCPPLEIFTIKREIKFGQDWPL